MLNSALRKLSLKTSDKYYTANDIAFLLLGISVVAQAIFVARYSTNVIFWDQFDLIPLLASKNFQWQLYFSQHNEHRMIFPELLSVFLARLSKWNVRTEIFLNWILLQCSIVMLYQILKENVKREHRWLILLSLCFFLVPQYYENLLWGFQGHVSLMLLVVSSGILALRYVRNIFLRLNLAMLCCVIASFSQANGLVSWFALLPLVIADGGENPEPISREKLIALIYWFSIGILAWIVYFWNFKIQMGQHPPVSYPWKYPIQFLSYFFTFTGGSLACVLRSLYLVRFLGLIFCCIIICKSFLNFSQFRQNISKFCLLLFLLLSGSLTSIGRAGFGLEQALSSRYLELSALIPVVMLSMLITSWTVKNHFAKIFSVFILIVILIGWFDSIEGAKNWHDQQQRNTGYLFHYDTASDEQLKSLHAVAPETVRSRAAILKGLGYNVFRRRDIRSSQ